ncbi:hypothetical protein C8A03DRAFT_19690, partial [Achaetomium macrosporum]
MTVRIDDRIYARRQQRKARGVQPLVVKANDKKKRRYPSTAHGTHAGPMDVDAAQREGRKGRKDKSQVTCFNCGKKGHFKNECRSKKAEWKPVPGKENATIDAATVRITEVAAASYTQDDLDDAIDQHLDSEAGSNDTSESEQPNQRVAFNEPITGDDIATRAARQLAESWGFQLTQDEEGQWKT